MNFDDQVVLITGASSGIGRSVAQAFSKVGASVAVHYNNGKLAAQDTFKTLNRGNHSIFQADISQPNEAKTLVSDVISKMGTIDVLVNNAGVFEHHAVPGTLTKSGSRVGSVLWVLISWVQPISLFVL